MTDKLPPLPEPYLRSEALAVMNAGWERAGNVFTAEQMHAYALAAVMAERERAARVCDDEARIRWEAGAKHPEDSESRGRCYAAARAAINCAKGVRNGEVVEPAAPMEAT